MKQLRRKAKKSPTYYRKLCVARAKKEVRKRDDDFQQVEKCSTCGILFWAISKWELGNWERDCKKCQKKIENEKRKKEENIKKNGTAVYGEGGQIKGWKLGDESLFNEEYRPLTEKEYEKIANGFMIF